MPENTGNIIEVKDLTRKFKNLTAVDRVSFEVRQGEVFGFLGPNGAGKTTTMSMIRCVSPPSGGMLKVFGMEVARFGRGIRKRLGSSACVRCWRPSHT